MYNSTYYEYKINHPHFNAGMAVVQWYVVQSVWAEVVGSIPASALFLRRCQLTGKIKKSMVQRGVEPRPAPSQVSA